MIPLPRIFSSTNYKTLFSKRFLESDVRRLIVQKRRVRDAAQRRRRNVAKKTSKLVDKSSNQNVATCQGSDATSLRKLLKKIASRNVIQFIGAKSVKSEI